MSFVTRVPKTPNTEICLDFDRGNGCGASFPCDANGIVDVASLPEAAQSNYAECVALGLPSRITSYTMGYNGGYNVLKCEDCGAEFHASFLSRGAMDFACPKCGALHNLSGQRLVQDWRSTCEEPIDDDDGSWDW